MDKEILLTDTMTLLSEYSVLSAQYQIAFETVKSQYASNPCIIYNSIDTNISLDCYKKLLSDKKCNVVPTSVPYEIKSRTFKEIASIVHDWSTNSDPKCFNLQGTNPNANQPFTYPTTIESIFATFPNKIWSSDPTLSTISSGNTSSAATCNKVCASMATCKSAMFDSNLNNCTLYSSDSLLSDDTSGTKSVLISLNNLKNRLDTISDKIFANLKQTKLTGYVLNNETTLNYNDIDILDKYNDLLEENRKIDEYINSYNTADTNYNEQKMFVNQQNLSYRYWTIATIIILIIIIKIMFQLESPSTNTIFWTTLIVLVCFTLNKPSGFAMFGIVFIILVLKTLRDYFIQ